VYFLLINKLISIILLKTVDSLDHSIILISEVSKDEKMDYDSLRVFIANCISL
jgi:hypothetical protein